VTVGVPVLHEFRVRTPLELAELRQELSIPADKQVVLVTGGGNGAQRLNQAVVAIAKNLLVEYPQAILVHVAGRLHAEEITKQYHRSLGSQLAQRVRVEGFTTKMYAYSAVADLVVARAGGTSIAEFAAQAKTCVIVPNPLLTGGHQLKNAKVLADRQAVALVDEADLPPDGEATALLQTIRSLLGDTERARQLAYNLHQLARPDAAKELALLLLEQASGSKV
jgi:UDP-N-acetylglucosamine--N-acetylmuramyl-(pentapeptide) pyrophosphoryl-undecaprenol N-acetylglucosamine transferase